MPTITRFEEIEARKTSRELTRFARFMHYLETHQQARSIREETVEYHV